jgi:DNA-directed RNA polymerase
MLKHLDTLTDLASRRTTSPDSSETTVAMTTTATAGEEGAAAEKDDAVSEECATSPTVSVVSKEQAMQLLKPGARRRRRSRSGSKGNAEADSETEIGDPSLEGKFVDLVDLFLPVPIKGEFDVNRIKSSLYFFS